MKSSLSTVPAKQPAAANVQWYQDQGITQIEQQSPHSVIVPGVVDAWGQLVRKHGSLDLGELLQPAIALARDGYAISPRVARDWRGQTDLLARDANAAKRFLPGGRAPRVGEVHHQPRIGISKGHLM